MENTLPPGPKHTCLEAALALGRFTHKVKKDLRALCGDGVVLVSVVVSVVVIVPNTHHVHSLNRSKIRQIAWSSAEQGKCTAFEICLKAFMFRLNPVRLPKLVNGCRLSQRAQSNFD